MIDRHNFWSTVSGVFTCLLIFKVISEGITGQRDAYYIENILTIFIITVVATFILSAHKYFPDAPAILVMLLQYLALIGSVMGAIWIASPFIDIHPYAYRDMFCSVTAAYVILAGIYYISFFRKVKKANEMLETNIPDSCQNSKQGDNEV